MISNRRGLNCNAQQCNFITFYFLDERKVACYKHGVIMQKRILSKKKKQTQLRTMKIPTATSG